MGLRLAEAGRRAAQPQTPTAAVRERAKGRTHGDLDLAEFRQRQTLAEEEEEEREGDLSNPGE